MKNNIRSQISITKNLLSIKEKTISNILSFLNIEEIIEFAKANKEFTSNNKDLYYTITVFIGVIKELEKSKFSNFNGLIANDSKNLKNAVRKSLNTNDVRINEYVCSILGLIIAKVWSLLDQSLINKNAIENCELDNSKFKQVINNLYSNLVNTKLISNTNGTIINYSLINNNDNTITADYINKLGICYDTKKNNYYIKKSSIFKFKECKALSEDKKNNLIRYLMLNNKGSFSFRNSNLTPSVLSILIKAMSLYNKITKIDISGNNLGETHLSLNYNQLSISNYFYQLGKAINTYSQLKILNISNNKLNEKHIKSLIQSCLICQSSIEHIDISNNNIGGEGMECLSSILKHNTSLIYLNLSNNTLGYTGTKHIADGLKTNNYLKRLDLSYNGITSKGAEYLSMSFDRKSKQNNILNIYNDNEIVISESNNLISLNLSGNYLLDEGIYIISTNLHKCKNLNYLFLEDNSITPKGMVSLSKAISKSNKLVSVFLNNNLIKDSGAISFYTTIKKCELYSIDLANNNITHLSMPILKELIVNSINNNIYKLGKLDLSNNLIGLNACTYLSDILKLEGISIKNLVLNSTSISDGMEKLYESIQNSETLRILELNNNNLHRCIKLISKFISKNKFIKNLDLAANHLDDKDMNILAEGLKANTSLSIIDLKYNKISLKGIIDYNSIMKENNHLKKTIILTKTDTISTNLHKLKKN